MSQPSPRSLSQAERIVRVASLNDTLRQSIHAPGRDQIVMTAGVAALIGDVALFRGFRKRAEILRTVRDYDSFNPDNDPLGEHDFGRFEYDAAKRTDWVTTLVRRRLGVRGGLPREERAAVAQAWRELNRIGINLNQATRALNASVMVESGLDVAREAARVASFRAEIGAALAGLGAALKGDLAYWDGVDA